MVTVGVGAMTDALGVVETTNASDVYRLTSIHGGVECFSRKASGSWVVKIRW
jgi:hypothetical protein